MVLLRYDIIRMVILAFNVSKIVEYNIILNYLNRSYLGNEIMSRMATTHHHCYFRLFISSCTLFIQIAIKWCIAVLYWIVPIVPAINFVDEEF